MNIVLRTRIIQASSPTFVNGSWRKPQISLRKLADLKKKFIREGKPWDIPEKSKAIFNVEYPKKPFKNHKAIRQENIQKKNLKIFKKK